MFVSLVFFLAAFRLLFGRYKRPLIPALEKDKIPEHKGWHLWRRDL